MAKRNLFKEIKSGLNDLKEERLGGKKLKKIISDTTNQVENNIQITKAIASPVIAMMGQAIIVSMSDLIQIRLKPFDYSKADKWLISLGSHFDYHLMTKGKKEISGYGVIVFKEIDTGLMSVCSTVDIALFLKNVSKEKAAEGKYGKGPKVMTDFEVFYQEYPEGLHAKRAADKLRTRIRQAGLNKV